MAKLKKILKKFRVILLIFFLLLSVIAISPRFNKEGVAIRSIDKNSSAYDSGMRVEPNLPPVQREIIKQINNIKVTNLEDYATALHSLKPQDTVRLITTKQEYVFLKGENLGLSVENAPSSNIFLGLELKGGTRVLLEPEEKITESQRKDVIATMRNRLNVYGLSDIVIREANDLKGTKYIIVEIAGATKQEVKDLIESQGRFEARIGNITVFEGGEKDIIHVCREDGTCAGIRACDQSQGGASCRFEFSIKLSEKAAKKHAETTKDLDINITSGKEYLIKPLDLYLDNVQVDSLLISSDLKGKQATDISISGPGIGATEQEAVEDALKNMNKLQTVLITGSLPTKMIIVKMDSISPTLGEAFVKNALVVGILTLLAVAVFIFIRYRKLKISIPILVISFSEMVLILGLSALIKYNLDIAAIAGIIAAVGTGVDDQIVITDEILSGSDEGGSSYDWKKKIKRAFFIILASYATTVAAMLPLLKAGAGLLTGFAFTTIAGVSIGVLITRPAFASIIQELLKED
ncbi:MAG: hypothetical protein KKG60_00155 [Nanoarchaeota archaeon]|nr:hypothetical protein [Nanoarchaeota archaeon]